MTTIMTKRTMSLIALVSMVLVLALSAEAYTITGQVNGSGSGPIAGALVEVADVTGILLNTTLTDVSGLYAVGIPDLAGFYFINASALSYVEQQKPRALVGDATVNFLLGPQPTVNVSGAVNNRTLGGVLVGTLPGAHIRAETGGAVLVDAFSDATGGYVLPLLMNRTYTITATLEGYTVGSITLFVDGASMSGVDLNLTLLGESGTVNGTVTNASSGLPLAGATLILEIPDGGVVGIATTNDVGVYSVESFSNSYMLTASMDGFNTASQSFNLSIGELEVHNFALASIGGPVDADGDGYSTASDCNDGNAAINPGATEVANGVDDDCDGATDEGFGGGSGGGGGGGTGGGGGGGGGGGRGGGGGGHLFKERLVNAGECQKTITVDLNDNLLYTRDKSRNEFLVTAVTPNMVKMRIFPAPSRDIAWDAANNRQMIDLDRDGDADIQMTLKGITAQRKATFDVRDIAVCASQLPQAMPRVVPPPREEEQPSAPVEAVVETLQSVKEGVINIIGDLLPKEKVSPATGGIVSLVILVAGLLGYGVYRRQKL